MSKRDAKCILESGDNLQKHDALYYLARTLFLKELLIKNALVPNAIPLECDSMKIILQIQNDLRHFRHVINNINRQYVANISKTMSQIYRTASIIRLLKEGAHLKEIELHHNVKINESNMII